MTRIFLWGNDPDFFGVMESLGGYLGNSLLIEGICQTKSELSVCHSNGRNPNLLKCMNLESEATKGTTQ